MKKNIMVILLLVLSSCFFDFEDSNIRLDVGSHIIYIEGDEVFSMEMPHFCYFFLSSCISCDSIKSKIELYASEHLDFYMVEAPKTYQKGLYREESIGAKCIEDIKFIGFPTLIFIENNILKEMYVGINEISNILF